MIGALIRCTRVHFFDNTRSPFLQHFRRRFGRNSKESFKPDFTKQEKQHSPYQEDVIAVRPPRDLWKAFGFTIAVGGVSFAAAVVADNERTKRRLNEWFRESTKKLYSTTRDPFSKLRRVRDGVKCTYLLVSINTVIMVMWGIQRLQMFMWKWFTNSVASKALCFPMVLSAFSHANILHLVLNMYVLNTFAPLSIDRFLGIDQFWAFYITAAAVSSLAGMCHKRFIGSNRRALGASGAILALLIYTCVRIPDAKLQIIFIPQLNFSANSAVIGIITFDLVCLLLGFKLFDHAAHLGGSLFGLFYATYGEKLFWKGYGDMVLNFYNPSEVRKRDAKERRRRRNSSL